MSVTITIFISVLSCVFINNTIYTQLLINLNSWLYNFLILGVLFLCFNQLTKFHTILLKLLTTLITLVNTILLSSVKFLILVIPLWVGTLNIHPPLFYLSFIILFVKFTNPSTWFIATNVRISLNGLLATSLSALVLGGIWGLQSLSWGYFWVNDSIEWVLLLASIYIAHKLHTKIVKVQTLYPLFIPVLLLTLLLLIRLNLVITRHNFFVTEDLVLLLIGLIFITTYLFINILDQSHFLTIKQSIIYNYILLFYIFKTNFFLTAWLSKYYLVYLFYFFFKKTNEFFVRFQIYIIHFLLAVVFLIWSNIFTFFFVNYSLLHVSLITVSITTKTILYSQTTYVTNSIAHVILEFVDFFIGLNTYLFNQLCLNLALNLMFNIFFALIFSFIIILVILLKGLNLDFYIKKKHIFKNRVKTKFTFHKHNHSSIQFIYSVKTCRIDLVSIRLFKKFLRRKFIKAKTRFFKPKYWILMMPNFLLTQKSKNSRMGAGVGKFVRLTSIVSSGKALIKTWYYTYTYLKYLTHYMHHKIPQKFLLKKCYK